MIYLFIFVVLLFLAFNFDLLGIDSSLKKIATFCIFTCFVCIAGLRYFVGGDSLGYYRAFNDDVPMFFDIDYHYLFVYKWEPLFKILLSLTKSVYDDFVFFQICLALFINYSLLKFFNNYTVNFFTVLVVYFFFNFLYFNTEILREIIAICIWTFMYSYYKSKKWKSYYILAVLAFGFHFSASILFLFPFFRNLKLESKTLVYFLFASGVLIVLNYMISIDSLLMLLGNGFSDKMEFYSNVQMNLNGVILKVVLFIIFPYLMIYYVKKCDETFYMKFSDLYVTYFALAFLYVAVSGFGRFMNYLYPFMMIFLADFVIMILRNYYVRMRLIKFLFVVGVSFGYKYLYYVSSTSHIVKNTTKFSMYYPYTSVLDTNNIDVSYRFVLYDEGLREGYYNVINK